MAVLYRSQIVGKTDECAYVGIAALLHDNLAFERQVLDYRSLGGVTSATADEACVEI